VLDTISRLKEKGVWVEGHHPNHPGHNDSETELTEIANFIKGREPGHPWHVTAFTPPSNDGPARHTVAPWSGPGRAD